MVNSSIDGITFQPSLSGRGERYLKKIYSLDDPNDWCMWTSTVLALEHFRGNKAWWPSQGLMAHQLEWRVAGALAINGPDYQIDGHDTGLKLIEDHLSAQGVYFARQYTIDPTAAEDRLDWHSYKHNESVPTLSEELLPGLVQYTRKGGAHIDFLLDLSESNHLENIQQMGFAATRVTTLHTDAT